LIRNETAGFCGGRSRFVFRTARVPYLVVGGGCCCVCLSVCTPSFMVYAMDHLQYIRVSLIIRFSGGREIQKKRYNIELAQEDRAHVSPINGTSK
jgi:hypothetical protein